VSKPAVSCELASRRVGQTTKVKRQRLSASYFFISLRYFVLSIVSHFASAVLLTRNRSLSAVYSNL